jgi:hypothetical protein
VLFPLAIEVIAVMRLLDKSTLRLASKRSPSGTFEHHGDIYWRH